MKKVIILLALSALSLCAFSCGGGAGSADSPSGENPGIPSVVQLLPSHYIAQTNSSITLHAKVLDGNGVAVPNTPVTFTNLSSPFGVLSSTSANTDNLGLATVTIRSTSFGFATVQAQVNTGVGQIRDKKTVFFSVDLNLQPFMILDVDGNNNGIFDQPDDFILFQNTTDNQVVVRATVFNRFGQREFGSVVTFGADSPYKIGSSTTCSDGSSSCAVSFPLGNTATTDMNGQASVLVQVDPIILTNVTTVLNITAEADNGAANLVSLFLLPVKVETVTVTANPQVVAPDKTSAITAAVALNTGGPAPDGTSVSFTTCDAATCTATCGSVTPFAQTTDGVAEAEFTAPSTENTCTITATAAGVPGSTIVTVTSALTVVPPSYSAVAGAGGAFTFTVTGGAPPYIINSSNPSAVFDSAAGDGVWNVDASGGTFIANVSATACPSSVTLTVSDSLGATKTVTITIVGSPILISPASAIICENTANCGGSGSPTTATFTISGGVLPYFTTSSNSAVILSPGVANPFTVDAQLNSITADTVVTLTVTDGCAVSKTATVTVLNEP